MNGYIKGCACVVVRKQQEKINKEDTTSPTVATGLVFTNAAVDTHKGRNIAMFDIPGGCFYTETDKYAIMLL